MDYLYGLIYLLITVFFIFNIESEDLSFFIKSERILRYIIFIPLSFYASYRFVDFLNAHYFTSIIYVFIVFSIKILLWGLYYDMKGYVTKKEISTNFKNYNYASKSEKINYLIDEDKMKINRDFYYNNINYLK